MIRNNLAKLMLERNIKATQISNKTKIARSTLSRIANNTSEKIEYSTINLICSVLKVTPCEFFEYSPIDCDFTFEIGDMVTPQSELNKGVPPFFEVFGFINFKKYGEPFGEIEYTGVGEDFGPVDRNLNTGENIYKLHINLKPLENQDLSIFKEISTSFQTDIIENFQSFIKSQLSDDFKNYDISSTINLLSN